MTAAQWAANGHASGQTDLMEPGAASYGEHVFSPAVQKAWLAQEYYKTLQAEIDKALSAFVPFVKSGTERPMINARENADRFAPVKARRVRFTIKATNNLVPCLDELEVFNIEGLSLINI